MTLIASSRAATASEADFQPAAAQHVERGGHFRQHGRGPQWQACHVGDQSNAPRFHCQRRLQRPGVEKPGIVGVILYADEVITGLVRELRQLVGQH